MLMTCSYDRKREKPRNAVVIAMMKRYGNTTTVMQDRRRVRGGSRNRVREYLAENY